MFETEQSGPSFLRMFFLLLKDLYKHSILIIDYTLFPELGQLLHNLWEFLNVCTGTIWLMGLVGLIFGYNVSISFGLPNCKVKTLLLVPSYFCSKSKFM